MWMRNLFFVAVLLGGAAALSAALFPSLMPPRLEHADMHPTVADDFPATVARLNDTFHKEWKKERLTPAATADDLAVARRLSLALTGNIPSLQEVRQFESLPVKDRLARWVASILADRRHADYFAERFARTYVGTEEGPFIVYRRRRFVSWLSDQIHENRPYDELVRDLIASRGLWTDVPATNFLTVTFENDKKGPNPERLAARVSRAFLGVRLDCAQCHDHPFEPWGQRDFQGLAAWFAQAHQGFTGIYDGEGEFEVENKKTKAKVSVLPRVPGAAELLTVEGPRRERLARWVTHPRNPYFARATVNRVWALMFGRSLSDPVDNLPIPPGARGPRDEPLEPPGSPAEDTGERKAHPALDLLAQDFIAHGFDLRRLIHLIAASEAFRLDSAADHELTDAHDKAWACFPMSRLRPEQVAGSILQAASVKTIDDDANIILQLIRNNSVKDFVHSYGDTGEDEFDAHSGTIPQRLLLMNGNLVHEKTKGEVQNAALRISQQAPTDAAAVETAYLSVLTRRPSAEEVEHFRTRLAGSRGKPRIQHVEDLFWTLLNATEFSWNH